MISLQIIVCVCVLFAQSCLTLCDPMDCSPPGSSVRGIFQARILEWVAMPFSRGSSQPRDLPRSLMSPVLADGFFTTSGEGNGTPLQYSCLENPTDGGAWWAAVHGVAKHRTQLSDFTFTFHFHALEKEMATHSSVLAWRIPGTGEPSGLPSMGSHRVGHDWSDLAAAVCSSSKTWNFPGPCKDWKATGHKVRHN